MRTETVGGNFAATLVHGDGGSALSLAWYDHGIRRHAKSLGFETAELSNGRFETALSKRLDRLMISAMAEREREKQREFREISELSVSTRDLETIAERLDSPEIRSSGNETGGFWFASPYSVSNGVFRLSNLEIPHLFQERATPVSHEIWDLSFFRNAYRKRMGADYGEYERSLALEFLKRAGTESGGHPLLGFCRPFNWHKHPGSPFGPSEGDLNHPSAEPASMYSGTALATLYAIANPYSGPLPREALEKNAVVLRAKSGRGYFLTFWKVLKVLPEERVRRRSAGLPESSGNLPVHLSEKTVGAGGGEYGPDLVPISIRTEDG